jgi:hypothetical protein
VNPILTKSYMATAAIAAFLIAKASGDRTVAVAADPEDLLVGAVGNLALAANDMADIVEVGISEVRLGGEVDFNEPLTADANGKAVAAAPVAGKDIRIIGFARAAGVADDVIPYLAAPGVISTPAAG